VGEGGFHPNPANPLGSGTAGVGARFEVVDEMHTLVACDQRCCVVWLVVGQRAHPTASGHYWSR